MSEEITIEVPEVFEGLFELNKYRYKVYYGGRGGGKSHSIGRAALVLGLEKPMRFLCAREFQKSIKQSVHKLLSDLINEYNLHFHYTVLETTIRGKNGTEFFFDGLKHNATGLKSFEGIDICWVEEAENVSANSWELLTPTIRKPNSEIWVSFNVKHTSDPTYSRFVANPPASALVKKVSWRDNPYFTDALRQDMLECKERSAEEYEHVWEGMPDTRRSGAILAKQLEQARATGRITTVPYDPTAEVFTAWDLGFGDSTTIWFCQFVGRELRWIDCYDASGEQLMHYVELIKSKPYNYMERGHYLPHDGAAGNIRGFSVQTQLAGMGIHTTILQRDSVPAGIELLRQTLAFSCFDAKKCEQGLFALENYKYEWDEGRQIFKSTPYHDWASDYADAARYAAQAAQLIKNTIRVDKPRTYVYRRPVSNGWLAS